MAEKRVKLDYLMLSNNQMMAYIQVHHNDDATKKAYAENALVTKEDGSKAFDLEKASLYFYDQYKNEIDFVNPPVAKIYTPNAVEKIQAWL